MKPLKKTIKKIRERIGVTPTVFADILGVNFQTVWNWGKGNTNPTDSIRADIFQVLLDAIMEDELPIIETDIELLVSCTRDPQDSTMIRILLDKLNETGKGK